MGTACNTCKIQNGRRNLERCSPLVFACSKQLSLNKFFDPSTPSMRKGRNGGNGKKKEKKTDENSGHYVIASSQPPERRPLERRTLAPIIHLHIHSKQWQIT